MINSHYVSNAGDYLELPMVHEKGELKESVHKFAFGTFTETSKNAMKMIADMFEDSTFHITKRGALDSGAMP